MHQQLVNAVSAIGVEMATALAEYGTYTAKELDIHSNQVHFGTFTDGIRVYTIALKWNAILTKTSAPFSVMRHESTNKFVNYIKRLKTKANLPVARKVVEILDPYKSAVLFNNRLYSMRSQSIKYFCLAGADGADGDVLSDKDRFDGHQMYIIQPQDKYMFGRIIQDQQFAKLEAKIGPIGITYPSVTDHHPSSIIVLPTGLYRTNEEILPVFYLINKPYLASDLIQIHPWPQDVEDALVKAIHQIDSRYKNKIKANS